MLEFQGLVGWLHPGWFPGERARDRSLLRVPSVPVLAPEKALEWMRDLVEVPSNRPRRMQ